MGLAITWLRRDLRLKDNSALNAALQSGHNVLPIFIFDEKILDGLPKDDARVNFIYDELFKINETLKDFGSSVKVYIGKPLQVWAQIIREHKDLLEVHFNRDYEPYALERDAEVEKLLYSSQIGVKTYKDNVIFEKDDILKNDGKPYTVYTPYKNKWLANFKRVDHLPQTSLPSHNFLKVALQFPALADIGFKESMIKVKPINWKNLANYAQYRDFPAKDVGSYLAPHLRFGTISIREVIDGFGCNYSVFLSELIWREFFTQILYHFPKVVDGNFKPQYNGIVWRNDEAEFEKWCNGETGYPIVDAGMRELNATGYMHNRVRMVVASFLCKHLLIDWRWGEAYFAEKLLDFDLAANNGNWQWVAGTGCDSAPYFRVFNPSEQVKKFDKELKYIKKWVPEINSFDYAQPMVEHKFARERCLEAYKVGIASVAR